MGAWPCGKIVMIGELYGSESMSQVYAQIHTLLQENAEDLKILSEYYNNHPCSAHTPSHHCFQLHIQQNSCVMMTGTICRSLHAMTNERTSLRHHVKVDVHNEHCGGQATLSWAC